MNYLFQKTAKTLLYFFLQLTFSPFFYNITKWHFYSTNLAPLLARHAPAHTPGIIYCCSSPENRNWVQCWGEHQPLTHSFLIFKGSEGLFIKPAFTTCCSCRLPPVRGFDTAVLLGRQPRAYFTYSSKRSFKWGNRLLNFPSPKICRCTTVTHTVGRRERARREKGRNWTSEYSKLLRTSIHENINPLFVHVLWTWWAITHNGECSKQNYGQVNMKHWAFSPNLSTQYSFNSSLVNKAMPFQSWLLPCVLIWKQFIRLSGKCCLRRNSKATPSVTTAINSAEQQLGFFPVLT